MALPKKPMAAPAANPAGPSAIITEPMGPSREAKPAMPPWISWLAAFMASSDFDAGCAAVSIRSRAFCPSSPSCSKARRTVSPSCRDRRMETDLVAIGQVSV